MKKGDIVFYTGEYEECHNFQYTITKVYTDFAGFDLWYDLEAVNPDIMTHYKVIWSVLKKDVNPT